jgi:hypothetical protein
MVKSIRQAGLRLIVAILKLFSAAPKPGWRRSTRPGSLTGR